MNIGDVGFCRGVHYGAGVISLFLCGLRLVYLAERAVILGTSPRGSSRVQTKSAKTRTAVHLAAKVIGWKMACQQSALSFYLD